MRAVCWYGSKDVRVEEVPEPKVLNARDAVVRITLTAICGSDLHLYNGWVPGMQKGDILGHEFMGEVVEVGREVRNLKKGDRVVVPFTISCGKCFYCTHQMYAMCDNSNPNARAVEKLYGYGGGGFYGYSHLFGGFAGGQAQYARVPFADVGCLKITSEVRDDQVLFLSDIFPTGYMAAENCNIQGGDTVAVWGCGPVGQFAIKSAWMLGAGRVVALDTVPERLRLAAEEGKAEVLNYQDEDVVERLKEITAGRGPDACIDAVGMEAHGSNAMLAAYDRAKQAARLETDRAHALRQAIQACRKGGTVSIPGVYGGFVDKFPIGAVFSKGLTLKAGQTNVPKYMRPLLERVERGEIDPSFVISHWYSLEEAPEAYDLFAHKDDGCTKVVMRPN